MDHHRRGNDGLGRPSSTASTASAHPRRSSHDMRDSQASSATNTSQTSSDNHAPTQSISFATPAHGVVSVNLTDLSNALGVRCGDVVSQRLMFQARSAPSHRVDRSLLSSALGGSGLLGGSGGSQVAVAPTSGADAKRDATSRGSDGGSSGAAPVTSPPLPRAPHYQRRHSTLRGSQLDGDSLAPSLGGAQSPGLPPLSSSLLLARPPPRYGTPPPPGGASAVRKALAGDRPVSHVAGSVPSPLRLSSGLLSRSGNAHPTFFLRRGPSGTSQEDENARDSDTDNERTGFLASSRRAAPARAQGASDVQDRDRLTVPGRHSSSSAAASPSSGATTPMPLPLRELDDNAESTGAISVTSPSRSVHFSENVIESINLAPGEDEYMHLLVVYSRPWYAYALLSVFGFLLGLSLLSILYLERVQPFLKDRATSVPFLLFLTTCTSSVGMVAHLALVWRPDSEEERNFFEDPEQRGQLPQLWSVGLLFLCGLTLALVFSHAIGASVTTVMVVALVGHLAVEKARGSEGGECITSWDVAGSVLVVLGALCTVASGAVEELFDSNGDYALQGGLLVLLGWGLSVLVSGVCWTVFTRKLREMSQRVSQQFLLTTFLVVGAVALGIGTYVADVMLSSDVPAKSTGVGDEGRGRADGVWGAADDDSWIVADPLSFTGVLLPCSSVFPDGAILLGGVVSFLLSWYAYHTVSFYVDHIAGAACMVAGASLSSAPLVALLALNVWPVSTPQLWAAVLSLSSAGMFTLVLGACMVIYGGVRYRREVEIRIVVE